MAIKNKQQKQLRNNDNDDEDSEEEEEEDDDDDKSFVAFYDIENFNYQATPTSITVDIRSATTTIGRNIISDDHDSTGIMIWPASHLLSQYLTFCSFHHNHSSSETNKTNQNQTTTTKTTTEKQQQQQQQQQSGPLLIEPMTQKDLLACNFILELGCGCGIVSSVLGKSLSISKSQNHHSPDDDHHPVVIVSTDMDSSALEMCRENLRLNQLMENANSSSPVVMLVESLCWGDSHKGNQILSKLRQYHSSNTNKTLHQQRHHELDGNNISNPIQSYPKFDLIIAADILYPATSSNEILDILFRTISQLLHPIHGIFLLSFATRNGWRTPMQLIQAATRHDFIIQKVPESKFVIVDDGGVCLSPTMDSMVLQLKYDPECSMEWNDSLGGMDCSIFPGVREAARQAMEKKDDSSQEEWLPPFDDDDFEVV